MYDTKKTCCFTGHRYIPNYTYEKVAFLIRNEIINLCDSGYINFICGGARGFDMLASKIVLRLKETTLSEIRLILALPCKGQDSRWNQKDRALYSQILNKADEVIYTSTEYFNGCMHVRNRYMVDNSSVCIAYLSKQTGGTAYTVNYAKEKGLKVINCIAQTEHLNFDIWHLSDN